MDAFMIYHECEINTYINTQKTMRLKLVKLNMAKAEITAKHICVQCTKHSNKQELDNRK